MRTIGDRGSLGPVSQHPLALIAMSAPVRSQDFRLNRSLLNPKFEGYKFNPLPQDNLTCRYGLQYKPSQINASASRSTPPMSFQEVQSRITHNHLTVGPNPALGVYMDAEHRVIGVTIDPVSERTSYFEPPDPELVEQTTLQPTFSVIAELPLSIHSSSVHDSRRAEYPSSAFVNSNTLLVADGQGMLYTFLLSEDSTSANLLGSCELRPASAPQSLPFRIHIAQQTSLDSATVLLSSRSYAVKPQEDAKQPPPAEFDLWGGLLNFVENSQIQTLSLWHRTGREVPFYSTFHSSPPSFHIFGGSMYMESEKPTVNVQPYNPTPDEIAPIPRAGEDLNAGPLPEPPPYSWTQTSDSVTVAFPLPSTTPKSAIKVTLTPKALNLFISGTSSQSDRSPIPFPRYVAKSFWDGIQMSTSFWTWDKAGEKSFGLLTLHLDKQHEGTRWSQVFGDSQTPSGELELEVAETLDPSELYNIRETLEKYTSSLSEDGSGLGLGQGVPSLGKGEIDEELDSSVGRGAFLTRIPIPAPQSQDEVDMEDRPSSITLLSTPLPGSAKPDDPPSLIIKSDIDGLLYNLTSSRTSAGVEESAWTHTSTFPALSFVLASKQDVRFTHHISDRLVLAFESGSRGLGFNIYIYQATTTRSAEWAKQSVIRVGDGATGPLLGVGALTLDVEGGKKVVILCLCENELVVIRDIPM